MERCLELASLGLGTTYPNPLVGSVIVHNDKIIGEGWHRKAGEPHAEVNAINSVADKSLLKEATIYVSLEPCSHFGKTPPCADLIVKHKIPKVVVGSIDPNPRVSGSGIQKLKDAGIAVTTGILKEQCDWINRRFFSSKKLHRPYIILKWAQTADGYIAPKYKDKKEPVWITGQESRQLVHKWRSEESAILIGVQTALSDDPSLTTRSWPGESPVRIVLDPNGRLTDELKVLDGSVRTLIFSSDSSNNKSENLHYLNTERKEISIEKLLNSIYEENLQSVIIEGGANTLSRFIDSGLWDEARVFTGSSEFGEGIVAPELPLDPKQTKMIHKDRLDFYFNTALL